MFNLKNAQKSNNKILPTESYLRKENIGPKADDDQPIAEAAFTDHKGYDTKTTEAQMEEKRTVTSKDEQVIEKVLNAAKSGGYVVHRSDEAEISFPPLAALVERLRQERLAEFKTEKKPHWSLTFDDQKQNGALPKWPKSPKQHDKTVLNNDPDRFKEKSVTPLTGNITVAQIDNVVENIKTGGSRDFDTAILKVLQTADKENRELTKAEQSTVSNLKMARTQSLIKNG